MKELQDNNVPGSWNAYQNIYNLVDGSVKPKDPAVYVVLSRMFNMKVEEVIERYSEADLLPRTTNEKENITREVDDNFNKINW